MSQMPDDALAATLTRHLIELLLHRGAIQGATLAELASVIGGRIGREERDLMRPLRTVVAALAQERRIEVVQDGILVDVESVRGPVRIRLLDSAASVSLSSPGQRLRNGFMAERRYTRGSELK
ncbi:MAG: DUF3253 domain-containing protein [Dokdonella sp.]